MEDFFHFRVLSFLLHGFLLQSRFYIHSMPSMNAADRKCGDLNFKIHVLSLATERETKNPSLSLSKTSMYDKFIITSFFFLVLRLTPWP